jgi:hypothetical protein
MAAAPAPRSPGSIDRVLREVEATLAPSSRPRTPRGRRRQPRRRPEWSRLPAPWRRRC